MMTREEIHKAYKAALEQSDAFYEQITNAAYNCINRRYLFLPDVSATAEQGTEQVPMQDTPEPNVLFMHSATIDAFRYAVRSVNMYFESYDRPDSNITLFGKPVAALNSLDFGEVKAGVIFNG